MDILIDQFYSTMSSEVQVLLGLCSWGLSDKFIDIYNSLMRWLSATSE